MNIQKSDLELISYYSEKIGISQNNVYYTDMVEVVEDDELKKYKVDNRDMVFYTLENATLTLSYFISNL